MDKRSARRVWRDIVQQDIPATTLARDGWLGSLLELGVVFSWVEPCNAHDSRWFERVLNPLLHWRSDEPVLYIERPDYAIETRYRVFRRHWWVFLDDDDEGPF